jgi:hypothetical protein
MQSENRGPEDKRDREPLAGLVERVTFHNPDSGFCVLRVKVRGHQELVTLLGAKRAAVPSFHLARRSPSNGYRISGMRGHFPGGRSFHGHPSKYG